MESGQKDFQIKSITPKPDYVQMALSSDQYENLPCSDEAKLALDLALSKKMKAFKQLRGGFNLDKQRKDAFDFVAFNRHKSQITKVWNNRGLVLHMSPPLSASERRRDHRIHNFDMGRLNESLPSKPEINLKRLSKITQLKLHPKQLCHIRRQKSDELSASRDKLENILFTSSGDHQPNIMMHKKQLAGSILEKEFEPSGFKFVSSHCGIINGSSMCERKWIWRENGESMQEKMDVFGLSHEMRRLEITNSTIDNSEETGIKEESFDQIEDVLDTATQQESLTMVG